MCGLCLEKMLEVSCRREIKTKREREKKGKEIERF